MPPNRVISCGPRLPPRLRLTYGPVRVVPRVRHRRRSERHRLRLAVGVGAVAVRGVLEESHDVVCRQPEHGIVAAKKSIDICTVQRSPLFCAPGLVKFVPAVARLFCLALPGSFLNVLCAE